MSFAYKWLSSITLYQKVQDPRFFMWRVFSNHGVNALLIVLFGLWGAKALFHPGLYTAHDIWHQVARIYHYSNALRDGEIFPLWIAQLTYGYGYPLFFFSYHLPWMIGGPLVLAGIDPRDVIKILFMLAYLGSGLTFYTAAFSMFRQKLPSLTGALLYLWAPYQFLSIFISASIGSTFIFLFLPVLFGGIYQLLVKGKRTTGVFFTTIGLIGCVLSHLMTTVMITPFLLLWVVSWWLLGRSDISLKQKGTHLTDLAKIGALTILCCAFYLVPLLTHLKFTNAHSAGGGLSGLYARNFPTLRQLVYSKWGVGPIVNNAKDGEISFQIGVAQWLAILLSITVLVVGWKTGRISKKNAQVGAMFISSFGVSVFLMLDMSAVFWQFGNSLMSLDYPFRLLMVSVFFGSLVAVWMLSMIKLHALKMVLALLLVVIAVYTNRNHIRVNQYTDIPLDLYIASEVTTNSYNEYLPKGVDMGGLQQAAPLMLPNTRYQQSAFDSKAEREWIATSSYELKNEVRSTKGFSFEVEMATASSVALHQFMFPGIQLWVDGEPREYFRDQNNLIIFDLATGVHQIAVRFIRSGMIWLSYGVSLVGVVLVGVVGYRVRRE